jgi:hypothetical protein
MLGSFLKALKNKVFLHILLGINVLVFVAGLLLNNMDLILLSGISYATVLLSIELNKDDNN